MLEFLKKITSDTKAIPWGLQYIFFAMAIFSLLLAASALLFKGLDEIITAES